MVVDAIAEIEAQNPQPLRSKAELTRIWTMLRKEVLTTPPKEIISDITNAKGRSEKLPAIQDISQDDWKPEFVTDPYNRKGITSVVRGQKLELGLESLEAGLNFTLQEEGTGNYLIPYPEFDQKGEYSEKDSFVIKLNEAQFQQIQTLVNQQ